MLNSGVDQTGLKIYLMGGFAVQLEGVWIGEEHWRSKRAHHLIKLLALAPFHQMQREQIAETLWPDSDLSASLNNFHQSLHGSRQALGPSGIECLVLESGMLRLYSPGRRVITVDADQFEAAAAAAESSKDMAGYCSALALYRGDLLPEDIYTEWTISRRDKLREVYLRLLYQQAGLYELNGAYRQAIDLLKRLVALDPCHEEGHIALMRLYSCSGERVLAIRQYHILQEQLKKDLDVEPGEVAFQLFRAIQSGKLATSVGARGKAEPVGQPGLGELGREAGPAKTEESPLTRQNLPRQLTSFIGREREVDQLLDLVKAHPLVTVTGAGGTGKTRLALQASERLLGEFPDGVYIVELAPLFDPDLVSLACIQVLELVQQADVTLLSLLVRFIGNKRLLLIFDTCEHVVVACAQLASELLKHCSDLHILATSREILSAPGEIIFSLPPLSYPEQTSLLSLDEIGAHEAVRLFVDRARQVSPDFALNLENAALVAQICRRLDGLPLAIELAAARLRVLLVEQIAGRLDHAFLLLTNGSRTALPRQQTLRAMIDWSYNLLSPPEQALLLSLSVFSGGWTLAAAEVICVGTGGMAGTANRRTETFLDLLGHLVDKSLVLVETRTGMEPRYRMLDTIRQYAHERLLEAGGETVLRDRHLAFFLERV